MGLTKHQLWPIGHTILITVTDRKQLSMSNNIEHKGWYQVCPMTLNVIVDELQTTTMITIKNSDLLIDNKDNNNGRLGRSTREVVHPPLSW